MLRGGGGNVIARIAQADLGRHVLLSVSFLNGEGPAHFVVHSAVETSVSKHASSKFKKAPRSIDLMMV